MKPRIYYGCKCKPQKGDILFSKTGSIGLSAIVDESQDFAVTQNAARINFKKEFYETEIKRYKEENAEIKVNAEKLEALSKDWDQKSDDQMHQHHRWAQATTTLQVAIAMAAIALLTRKSWLKTCMYVVGVLGIGVGALAVAHI